MSPADRQPRMALALALAGGGPLGAIYEIGTVMALSEALDGFDFNDLDAYVGVSAGGFIAAGLANGLSPAYMYRMFIDSESAEVPFEPEMLLKPAFGEYAQRAATVPALLLESLREYLRSPLRQDLAASFQRLSQAIPTGVFNNAGIKDFLTRLFSLPGLTNDFRQLKRQLFLIATDLDSGGSVAFGSKGYDHIPIATAVQASSALPGLFPPVEIDGHWFVDGALKKTLHASVALKEGAQLVICINPLVPFDARHASHEKHLRQRKLVDGGLPVVLAQTFRAIIHSRMETGLAKYDIQYKDADVILFEPSRDDADMFFTNMFSYSDRKRLSEQAYRKTREELLRRYDELAPKLARHGVSINRSVLADPCRSLTRRMAQLKRSRARSMGLTALRLSDTLDDLARAIKRLQPRQAA
ncbi:MAG: patatin-like phospholipase family protein [Rhodocyclales bacterium]|nr:patatin-like phospholipase family protein [Rhodocyclales bacterium]